MNEKQADTRRGQLEVAPIGSTGSTLQGSRLLLSLAEEGLRRGHRVRVRSLGDHMAETIREGEWITVEPIAPVSVREGDVVLVRDGEIQWARRVIAVRERPTSPDQEFAADFAVRGDTRGSVTSVVGCERLLGRVVAVDRDGMLLSIDPPARTKGWRGRRVAAMVVPVLVAAAVAMAAALIGVLPMVKAWELAAAAAVIRSQK